MSEQTNPRDKSIPDLDPRLGPPIDVFTRAGRRWTIGLGGMIAGGLFTTTAGLIGAVAFVVDPQHHVGNAVQALWLPVGLMMLWALTRMRPVPLVVAREGFANGARGSGFDVVLWSDVDRFEVESGAFGGALAGTLRAMLADPEGFARSRRLRRQWSGWLLRDIAIPLAQFEAPAEEVVHSMERVWQSWRAHHDDRAGRPSDRAEA